MMVYRVTCISDTVRSRNLASITMDDLVKEAAEHGRGKGYLL